MKYKKEEVSSGSIHWYRKTKEKKNGKQWTEKDALRIYVG